MQHVSPNRLWHLLVNVLGASAFLTQEQRVALLARGGIHMNGTAIRPGCWFHSDRVSFGTGGMINRGAVFENVAAISVGSGVFFGPEVMVLTSTHDFGSPAQRAGTLVPKEVSIGDGCWLGARVTVFPGVRIGDGCIIGAGSVVTRDIEPNQLCSGVPAQPRRSLEDPLR